MSSLKSGSEFVPEFESILDAAISYAKSGLSVIPVTGGKDKNLSKKPLESWQEWQGKIPSESQIRKWWKRYPTANVGIVCGGVSGIVMVDADDKNAQAYIETIVPSDTPRWDTSRGRHYMFKHNGEKNEQGVAGMKIDVRGEGGFVVAPPSIHFTGKVYEWITPYVDLKPMPSALLNKNVIEKPKPIVQSSVEGFRLGNGNRHDKFMRILGSYRAKGCDDFAIRLIGQAMIDHHIDDPEEDMKGFKQIIESVCSFPIGKSDDTSKEIEEKEIRDYIMSLDGDFSSNSIKKYFKMTETSQFAKVDRCISRMKKSDMLIKVGKQAGLYRNVVDVVDYEKYNPNMESKNIDLWLPLSLNLLNGLKPKSIIAVAGASNAGKTAFAFEIMRQNKHIQWRYIDSENSQQDRNDRMKRINKYMGPYNWDNVIMKGDVYSHYEDYVDPDGYTIIDYVDVPAESFSIVEHIAAINNKLRNGVCIVLLQKKKGYEFAFGGEGTKNKPKLYLALDFQKVQIIKGKIPLIGKNIDGMYATFKLTNECTKFSNPSWFTQDGEPFVVPLADGRAKPVPAKVTTSVEDSEVFVEE